MSPTGGTIIIDGLYTIHKFTSSGTFTIDRSGNVTYLVCGAGGSGGPNGRGGGGGGQVLQGTTAVTAQSYAITVGQKKTTWGGNDSVGGSGQQSIFSSFTANGGRDGGDPAGGTQYGVGGAFGSPNGGTGLENANGGSNIDGVTRYYGSGGGGAGTTGNVGAPGAYAGYGAKNGVDATTGEANFGGGGGGGGVAGSGGGNYALGADGVVIIRYLTSDFNPGGGFFNFF